MLILKWRQYYSQLKTFRDPEKYYEFRKELESTFWRRYETQLKGTQESTQAIADFTTLMAKRLEAKPELLDKIILHWRFPIRSCSLSLKRSTSRPLEAELDTWRSIYGLYYFLTTSSLSIRLHDNGDQGELVELRMESKLSFLSYLNKI